MISEPVIELGEDWELPEEPGRDGLRTVSVARVVGAALALTLMLGLLGRSAPPREPALMLLDIVPGAGALAGPSSGIQLVGDLLIVHWPGQVSAYDANGDKRWDYRGQAAVFTTMVRLLDSRSLLVAGSIVTSTPGEGPQRQPSAVALDPGTGRELWQIDAALRPVAGLLAGVDPLGRMRVYQGNPPRLVWQTEPLRASTLDSRHETVLGLTYDGVLREYGLSTGKLQRSREVQVPPDDGALNLWAIGDQIFLGVPLEGTVLLVLDNDTFAPKPWRSDWLAASDCGPVICVFDPGEQFQTHVLDPETGQTLWTATGHWLNPTQAGLLAMAADDGESWLARSLLDPFTGAVREQLTGWRIAASPWSVPEVLFEPRQETTRIAVLEPDGLHVIGTVYQRLNRCQYHDGLLFCHLENRDLGVWRVRP